MSILSFERNRFFSLKDLFVIFDDQRLILGSRSLAKCKLKILMEASFSLQFLESK